MIRFRKTEISLLKFIGILTSIALIALLVATYGPFKQNDNFLNIAVVAPTSGTYILDGQDMVNGVKLYVDKINDEGGINGQLIRLIELDDQNKRAEAAKRAQEIVDANEVLVVIGHAFSSSSVDAGKIYAEHKIPAITGSATAGSVTEGRDWYFRVIPSSQSQSVFLANYLMHVAGYTTATIIHDVDTVGISLAEPFQEEFTRIGGTLNYVLSFDSTADDLEAQLEEIVDTLIDAPDGEVGAIYFATHVAEGVSLVTQMKDKGLHAPRYGTSAFANIDFIEGFKSLPKEILWPGYYSDGFYTIAPIIFDVAGKVGQDFRQDFLKKYGEPGMKAATHYDAVMMAVEAMKNADISGKPEDIEADREKIREYLAGIDDVSKAVEGVTGKIYFDEQGDIIKPVSIGVYQQQQRISAMTQLQPIQNKNQIEDLPKALLNNEVLIINDQYVHKTDVVYAGVDFIEVSNVNEKSSSYTMDFYLWFRSQGDVEAENIEFTNASKSISLGKPVAEREIDGVQYQAYRIKADFLGDFLFQAYPFDHQKLEIKFRHANKTREQLIYVIDFIGMGINAETTALEKITDDDHHVLNIGSWKTENASFFQDIISTRSTLGDPAFFGSNTDIEYSRFNALIDIERDTISFGIKNLIPLFAVTILAYLSIFLPPSQFSIKNAIGRGALMTVAFFHIKLSNDLPGIGYTVALDYVFYMMYALIVVDLILSVVTQYHSNQENHQLVARLILIGKVYYPVVLIVGLLIFSFQYGLFGLF